MDRLGDGDRLEVGYARTMLAPLVPLALVAAAVLGGLSPGAVVLLLLLLLVVLGVSVLGLLSPGVVVQGDRLSVPGREDRRRAPGGSVDLSRLVSATSVSYQGGRVREGPGAVPVPAPPPGRVGRRGDVPGVGVVAQGSAPGRAARRRVRLARPDGSDDVAADRVPRRPGCSDQPSAPFPVNAASLVG